MSQWVCLDQECIQRKQILEQLDIKLSQLRDAIIGTGGKTLTDIYDMVSGIKTKTDKLSFDANSYLQVNVKSIVNPPNLDVQLSTRASETTLQDIKSQTDKLSFDGSNNLLMALNADNVGIAKETTLGSIKSKTDKLSFDANDYLLVNVKATVNPPNLDTALSTRASENTLSNFSAKFPNATALSDSMGNPTTTVVGSALLGWTGSIWRRIVVDNSGRLKTAIDSIPSLPSGSNIIGGVFADYGTGISIDQQVGTTEVTGSTIDVRRRGRKIVYIKNTQDVDVIITIEGSYNGSDWFVIRDNITVPSGDYRIGELNGAFGYIRAKAVASGTPSSGKVQVIVGSLT